MVAGPQEGLYDKDPSTTVESVMLLSKVHLAQSDEAGVLSPFCR